MGESLKSINIDLSKFTFTAEQIRDINELVYEGIAALPALDYIHQFYPGIVYDKEVGFITGGGLVGKKGQGCDPEEQDWEIGTRKMKWEPKEWEIYLSECAKELKNTCAVYCMNKGTRVDDLTDTDLMEIVVEVLIDAVLKFMYRLIWFNDTDATSVEYEELPTAAVSAQTAGEEIVGTVYEGVESTAAGAVKCATSDGVIVYLDGDAATGTASAEKTYYTKDTVHTTTVSNGGQYTEDIDTGYFDIIDGLFKQLRAAVISNPALAVEIDANSKSTKAQQMSALTPQKAYDLLSAMWYKAPIKLRQAKADRDERRRPRFYVTQSVADAYEQYLLGKGIKETYDNLVDGIEALTFLGVPVIPMAIWDEMIQSYQDMGATYFKPHRALLTCKAVLAVGLEGETAFGEFEIWYNKDSRKNKVLMKDKLDAKLANPEHLIYAE